MFFVQLSNRDLDHVFVEVRDDERREYTLYAGQGDVGADKCGVEVGIGGGSFVIHIHELAHVVQLDFELKTRSDIVD